MEQWKDIYFWQDGVEYDYRGLYQVSNFGRVKSLKYGKEQILKPGKNEKGYEFVKLCKNSKQKKFKVHRLVAFMFLTDSYFDGAEIDHIDTNRTNNHHTNLRWCTNKENCNNEMSKKHYSEARKGEKNSRAVLVDRFDLKGNYIDTLYQFEYVQMGFYSSSISACCVWYACGEDLEEWHKIRKGHPVKSTGGFVFKYHKS